jgi:hypothetical protein
MDGTQPADLQLEHIRVLEPLSVRSLAPLALLAVPAGFLTVVVGLGGVVGPNSKQPLAIVAAVGIVWALFGILYLWGVIRALPAARLSARIHIMQSRLTVESKTGRATSVTELAVSQVFCCRVVYLFGSQHLRIETHSGEGHDFFRRRPIAELEEVAAWLNERLGVLPRQDRVAAWFAAQSDVQFPGIDLVSREVHFSANRDELIMRIPPTPTWTRGTVVAVLVGLAPQLLILGLAAGLTAYLLWLGKSPLVFWQRARHDVLTSLWEIAPCAGLWTILWWGFALLASRPRTTVTVSSSKVLQTQQRGRRITSRELDVRDVTLDGSTVVIDGGVGRKVFVHAGVSQRLRIQSLLLEACGLKAPSSREGQRT